MVQEHNDKEVAEVLAPLYDGMTMETLIEKVKLSRIAYSPDCLISKEGYKANALKINIIYMNLKV